MDDTVPSSSNGKAQQPVGGQQPAINQQSDKGANFQSSSGIGGAMQKPSPSPVPPNVIIKGQRQLPIIPLIIIAVILALVVVFFLHYDGYILKSATTTTTSSIQSKIATISSCEIIPRPGYYFVDSNIKTQIQGGPCINVSVSNVNIVCDSNKIGGSGPFVIVPPFTYGIWIVNKTNITVSGCNIVNFSYGVFVQSSNNINIDNNNVSVNYVSNIYLNNTHNSTVNDNYLSRASGPDGSIFLTNRTTDTNIINNTVQYDLFFGINVNSSNNTFARNFLNDTEYSFRCSVPNGFVISSRAYSNVCYNSTGCGFIQCRGINIPTNISKLTLQNPINECGSIVQPGTYVLESNISMNQFVNISNILSLLTPCIRVASKNVVINCKGFGIYNSTTAISDRNMPNVTIENCRINNAAVGIALSNASLSHVSNISLNSETYGVELLNTSLASFSNITATGDTYGISLSSSFSNIFQQLSILRNTYGIYLSNNSFSNTFNKGRVLNSSKIDVYATSDSQGTSYDLMLSITCGYTNALWGTCEHYIPPQLPYVPITTCGAISNSGNYLLFSGIVNARGRCLQITASNVVLNCINHLIAASPSATGPGILVSNAQNVTIYSCSFANFPSAINISNSSGVTIKGTTSQDSGRGIFLDKAVNVTVYNSVLNGTVNASIELYHTSSSKIYRNLITYGQPDTGIGILLNGSQNNTIRNNSESRNNVGLELVGKSENNTIRNNTMQVNTKVDYMCMGNSALDSENGGINYGTTKLGCGWLAVITPENPVIECPVVLQPGLILITQDYEYSAGSICFTVYANSTTINCNGHTIIATNGGTFADFINTDGSYIKNCFLKGFSDSITAKNVSSFTVFNNTILENSSASTAITISNARLSATVQANNVSAAYHGISLSNMGVLLEDNYVTNAKVAYALSNVTSSYIKNNTASASTYNGIIINDSVINTFQDNNFTSAGTGMLCTSKSVGRLNNTDGGYNSCTSNVDCFWISGSSPKCQ